MPAVAHSEEDDGSMDRSDVRFNPSESVRVEWSGGTVNGKGSRRRPEDAKAIDRNWKRAMRKRKCLDDAKPRRVFNSQPQSSGCENGG